MELNWFKKKKKEHNPYLFPEEEVYVPHGEGGAGATIYQDRVEDVEEEEEEEEEEFQDDEYVRYYEGERTKKKKRKKKKKDRFETEFRGYAYGNGGYSGSGYGQARVYDYGDYNYRNYTGFNWSYQNVYSPELSEDKLHYAIPKGYAMPNKNEIEKALHKRWQIGTEANLNIVGNMIRFFYAKMIDEPDYLKPPYDAYMNDLQEMAEQTGSSVARLEEHLRGVVPVGAGPLERAINAFVDLANMTEEKRGRACPFKIDTLGDEEGMNIRHDVFTDPTYTELLDRMEHNQDKKVGILQKLSLIQDFGTEFKVEAETEEKLAANSMTTSRRRMHDYSQMHMVEVYQRLLPNFHLKMLHKDLTVRVHVDRKINKQKIIILVDYSRSMDQQEKQEWVMALVMDRLKYAIKGEAEIFFSFFCNSTAGLSFTHIHDSKSAMDFWRKFQTNPDGGGTNIGLIVDYIGKEVEKGRLHNLNIDLRDGRPELLIINDGQDSIKTDAFSYKSNAVTLLQDNEELKHLCLENRGKYVHIDKTGKVVYN